MIDKSKEFVIPEESLGDFGQEVIFDKISELCIKPLYIFCSDKSRKLFGITKNSRASAFPSYFYNIDKYPHINLEILYSPLISEEDDELILYAIDNSIQSLVYSIQNMDYKIEPNDETNSEWKHTMFYNLYDCRFNSYKLSIRNVSRLRNDKINKILNGN